jgi:ribosomal protein S18 acetylase RimI-like enzyme
MLRHDHEHIEAIAIAAMNCDERRGSMFTVHRASSGADWHQATALLYDYVEWMRAWTDFDPLAEQPRLDAELAFLADHYATDTAVLYLVDWQASAVGVVAIRAQSDGSAELKRLYVRPIARGLGIADRLIDAAVAGATERQCHTVWLETVRGAMDRAIAVYRRNGFVESSTRPATLSMDGVIVMERILSVASRSA